MATSILLLVFLLAATTASARPCKTLFYFSATTTTTYYPYNSLNQNPNPNSIFHRHSPRYLTLIFTTTTTTRFPNHRGALNFASNNPLDEDSQSTPSMMTSSDFPVKFYSSVSSSIRDRTRDIISVLGALLFGVGCGVLTGLAVYLVWPLFSPRRFEFDDVSSSSSDDDDDDVTVAKKLGYVAIPAKSELVEDDLKKPALPAKEVV